LLEDGVDDSVDNKIIFGKSSLLIIVNKVDTYRQNYSGWCKITLKVEKFYMGYFL
jgi:hypothetical protein